MDILKHVWNNLNILKLINSYNSFQNCSDIYIMIMKYSEWNIEKKKMKIKVIFIKPSVINLRNRKI